MCNFKQNLLKLTIAAVFSTNIVAHASAIDIIDNGSLTTDTISGLDWLDTSFTLGKSYNEVTSLLQNDANYTGYRYASSVEVSQLVDHYTGSANYQDYQYSIVLLGLTQLLTPTFTNPSLISNPNIIYGLTSDSLNSTGHFVDTISVSRNIDPNQTIWYSNYFQHDLSKQEFETNVNIASFLVRDTPYTPSVVSEPEVYAMFLAGLGLVGFAVRRRELV